MNLFDLLSENKSKIFDEWLNIILGSYSDDASNFFKKEKDPFANPVGNIFREASHKLFEILILDESLQGIEEPLDKIVRIKAVQDFSPSQAIQFIFHLKPIIRDVYNKNKDNGVSIDSLLAIESRIDQLALMAFDNYMDCREKIYEIKANQVKNMSYKLLERSNMLSVTETGETCVKQGEDSCSKNGGCEK